MTHYGLAQIAIRLLALFTILQAVQMLPYLTASFSAGDSLISTYGVSALFPLVLGCLLWVLTPLFASWMTGRYRETEPSTGIAVQAVLRTVTVLFGLYLLINAIPNLVYITIWAMDYNSQNSTAGQSLYDSLFGRDSTRPWSADIAAELTRIALGVVLLLGRPGLERGTLWLRDFGLKSKV